ncbi:hypothetical protein AAU57_05725 [Nonlabens sp. YIK11]|uniref:tetratricopeptide repeat protein n=1 Tax=Nonlabens sp. YIK11 TaxID=1453349 RepID=UPI0006DC103B|nr:hypothetical protein [Nonlabens sp. YIK11]KQC32868.1 hypothetical protein AAU57_05725 [Nonlabens sp. YIK11]
MEFSTLIQKIIHQRASKEELELFEDLINNNTQFKELYNEALDIKAVATDHRKSVLREIFKKQELKHENLDLASKKTKDQVLLKIILPLVGAAAVILLFLNIFGNEPSAFELFENNYEPYRNVMGSIERGTEISDDMVSRAFYAYEIKDYELSSKLLDSLYQADPQTIYLFYLANSQLGLGHTENAISLYQRHQKVNDDFYARSRWYLALAYLRNGNVQESKKVLQAISKAESFNYIKARELLEDLEHL